MQRATCASDDLDCQCTWASKSTTCFAPCISEKEFSDGMHVARGEQDTICSQAAKYGQLAKDKEKQKQDEKNNKGKKKDQEQWSTTAPKDLNDVNSTHDNAKSKDGDKSHDGVKANSDNKPQPAAGPHSGQAPKLPAGHNKDGSAAGSKARKSTAGGDKEFNMPESSASALAPVIPGMLALLGSALVF
ncbi:hypothetical protein GGF43_002417 [Coemansia sp. RSA 2618]|nr:hypothetical protein GGF43_002417 [Coemansia sp. RSA 2618]